MTQIDNKYDILHNLAGSPVGSSNKTIMENAMSSNDIKSRE